MVAPAEITSQIGDAVDHVLAVAGGYLSFLAQYGVELAGARLLEVGPGKDFGPALILASKGAEVTVADPYLPAWDPAYHPFFYRRLAERWNGARDQIEEVIERGDHRWPIRCVKEPAEALASLASGFFDAVVSAAVLEHTYDLPAACRELFRVTKPGGVHSHQYDHRDHRDFARPLEFLLMTEGEFLSIAKPAAYCFGNRWRPSEVIANFTAAGFGLVAANRDAPVDPDYLADFVPRLRQSNSPYRNTIPDDLGRIGMLYFLRRPG
jgi:SAM-dependent methyltransferase